MTATADDAEARERFLADAARRAMHELLVTSRELRPAQVLDGVRAAASHFGATDVAIYLNDYEQRVLRLVGDGEVLGVDSTVPGRAFSTDTRMESVTDDGVSLWLPLLNGAARLGVLQVVLPDVDDHLRELCDDFVGFVAELIVCRNQYTDTFVRTRRRQDMSLAAEMCWHLLPPLTFSAEGVTASAMLEPAYEVGGDSFDYASNGSILHAAVFDAMGHGVSAAMTAALVVGAYRHARRSGADLRECYEVIDSYIREHGSSTFATGVLAELNCDTGCLRWLNAGHPAPMLVRERAVQRLECTPALPIGIGGQFEESADVQLSEISLQGGDRVLLFSDGCTEAATRSGEPFGEERLGDFLVRQQSAGLGVAETLRRLGHAVLEHAGEALQDDATVVLVQYGEGR